MATYIVQSPECPRRSFVRRPQNLCPGSPQNSIGQSSVFFTSMAARNFAFELEGEREEMSAAWGHQRKDDCRVQVELTETVLFVWTIFDKCTVGTPHQTRVLL